MWHSPPTQRRKQRGYTHHYVPTQPIPPVDKLTSSLPHLSHAKSNRDHVVYPHPSPSIGPVPVLHSTVSNPINQKYSHNTSPSKLNNQSHHKSHQTVVHFPTAPYHTPSQINANSLSTYPSSYKTYQKLKNDHIRTRSNGPVRQSSIPPPPPIRHHSRSPNLSSESRSITMNQRKSSDSDSSSSCIDNEHHFTTDTRIELNDVLVEIEEDVMTELNPTGERNEESPESAESQPSVPSRGHSRTDTMKAVKSYPNGTFSRFAKHSEFAQFTKLKLRTRSASNDTVDDDLDAMEQHDLFWKRYQLAPYIGLAMMTSIFMILFFVYFTNLYTLLAGGLVPCTMAIIVVIPIYYFFRKYDSALKFKSMAIADHVVEAEWLKNENEEYLVKNKELQHRNGQMTADLEARSEEIEEHKRKIDDLSDLLVQLQMNQMDSPRESLVDELETKLKNRKSIKKLSLLQGFRKGQMEEQLEMADINDLVHMLPIVISCITLLPFGMTGTRKKLQRILEQKIADHPYLRMQLYLFLASFLGCTDVKRLFRKHRVMKHVVETIEYFNYSWNEHGHISNGHDRIYSGHISRKNSEFSEATSNRTGTLTMTLLNSLQGDLQSPTQDESGLFDYTGSLQMYHNPMSPTNNNNKAYGHYHHQPSLHLGPKVKIGGNAPSILNLNCNTLHKGHTMSMTVGYRANKGDIDGKGHHQTTQSEAKLSALVGFEETVVYTEKDPVKLFRMPLDKVAAPGFRVVVPKKLQSRFFDPIRGTPMVQQLKVRKMYNSNAKPYLVDCYVFDESANDLQLSSSYILKQGDDLRKDAAVLKMFEFMNELWRGNEVQYKEGILVEALTYKVIPMGPDVGMIEEIADCIELSKISSLKTTLKEQGNVQKYHRLIASAAGAFIASFILGIRDRHDDNILISEREDIGCTLFHIDFGYMFGDRVGLDTAKLAITSDLKKVIDLYKFGWSDFVDLCCSAWMVLRKNANELIDYARVVFHFLYETNQIEMFLRSSLKLEITEEEAAEKYIRDKLKNAPKQLKTKMKNLVHGFAQKIKLMDGKASGSPGNQSMLLND